MYKRIVSLLPSATEIVCSLGLKDNLVGISHECDYPDGVRLKEVMTKARIDSDQSSIDIDKSIRNIIQKGLSIYEIDEEKLKRLKPDLIVTQDQCDVCAIPYKQVEEAAKSMYNDVDIISLKPESFNDIFEDILNVGKKCNKEVEAQQYIDSLKERVNFVKERTENVKKVRTACIEWIDPIMLSGNWIPDMVEIAGGINLGSEKRKHSSKINLDELVKLNPEVILVMPCGFDIPRTLKEINTLTNNKQWNEIDAVKNKRVYLTDGNSYFNRPGPRIADSLEILAQCIHPELFNFNFNKEDYENLYKDK